MKVLERLFDKPFEVTQFWASEEYVATGKCSGETEGRLLRYCPEAFREHQPAEGADWFFQVSDGEGGPFAGDFLPRFLPTRNNIRVIDRACIKASLHLGAALDNGKIEGRSQDDELLFDGLDAYYGDGPMDISNRQYRNDLWHVLKTDWGLVLPQPSQFGLSPVLIEHRAGLPCAAAMVRAVLPLLEASKGELKRIKQSTVEEHARTFDVIEYSTVAGERFTQRFDITALFGRNDLDWTAFHF